jgi:hypothetical protein
MIANPQQTDTVAQFLAYKCYKITGGYQIASQRMNRCRSDKYPLTRTPGWVSAVAAGSHSRRKRSRKP